MLEVRIEPTPELFEDYNELFRHLIRLENFRMLAPNPDFSAINWSFTLYPPDKVSVLVAYMKEYYLPIQKACDQGLPLLEICTGDFALPDYIVVTPDLDIAYLKKRWALDYCACHNLTITEKD